MKRFLYKLLLLIVLGVSWGDMLAQIEPPIEEGTNIIHFSFETVDIPNNQEGLIQLGFSVTEFFSWEYGGKYGFPRDPDPITKEFKVSKLPRQILIYHSKKLWGSIHSGENFTEYSQDINPSLAYNNFSFNIDPDQKVLRVNVEVLPKYIKLYYNTLETEIEDGKKTNWVTSKHYSPKYLSQKIDRTYLAATPGFPKNAYNWQYRVQGLTSGWVDFPKTLAYERNNSVVGFTGLELLGQDLFRRAFEGSFKVEVRINTITDVARTEDKYPILTLVPTPSAPHFKDPIIVAEKCLNSGKGASVTFFFDRALKKNEELYLIKVDPKTNEDMANGQLKIILNNDNSFEKTKLEPGEYIFKLKGSINNIPTFTSSDKHQIEVSIPKRIAIDWSIDSLDVHCFGGRDGGITVKASRGTGLYTVGLYKGNSSSPLKTKTFGDKKSPESEWSTSFNGLTAGIYTLKLIDSNKCTEEDGVKKTITINQPNEAVIFEKVSKKEPLAYNSKDGKISVLVKGGSPAPNGYKVTLTRQSDKEIFEATRVGSNLYEFNNIPAGEYLAVAKDERFALESPQDQDHPCGCKAQLLTKLTAPSEIKVEIKEHNPINCHGDNNGSLVAHAIGGKRYDKDKNRFLYEYHWFRLEKGGKKKLTMPADSIIRNLTSGNYLVKVIDANGVEKESTPFFLDEPKILSLDFEVQQPSCNNSLGKVKAIVKGGTPPYTYQWNREGEAKEVLSNIGTGSYVLRVKDNRGCSIINTVKVKAPNEVEVKHISKKPTCHSATDGSIELILKGGTAPIKVKWKDNNSTSLKRDNLKAGTYIATITDQQNCSFDYKVVLDEPKELKVTLSSGFTLCKGQSATLTATANQENVTYQWRRNGQLLGETSNTLLVDEAGLYEVTAINSNNCPAIAQQRIKMSNVELPLDFTMPSSAEINTQIHAVNISRVKAERLEWQLPKEAKVISKNNNDLVFSMPKAGLYTLRFIGYKGDCSTIITQSFQIKDDGSIVLPIDGEGTPAIKQFLVSPNPTKGAFKVRIELNQAQDFSLMLYSPSMTLMDTKHYKNSKEQIVEYELRGKIEGLFSIKLKTAKEESILKIKKER